MSAITIYSPSHYPMDRDFSGELIRLVMANHAADKPTTKAEISRKLEIKPREIERLLLQAEAILAAFGLELVGISSTGKCIQIEQATKLFIRAESDETTKKAKTEIDFDFKRLYLIFALIAVQNNELREKELEELGKCDLFCGVDIGKFFEKQRVRGYLSVGVDGNELVQWSYGWRYYAEFGDLLSIVEYYKNLVAEEYEQENTAQL